MSTSTPVLGQLLFKEQWCSAEGIARNLHVYLTPFIVIEPGLYQLEHLQASGAGTVRIGQGHPWARPRVTFARIRLGAKPFVICLP